MKYVETPLVKPPQEPLRYPCLMQYVAKNDDKRCTVLFTSLNRGMKLGECGFENEEDGWISADNRGAWEPFVGTITITE